MKRPGSLLTQSLRFLLLRVFLSFYYEFYLFIIFIFDQIPNFLSTNIIITKKHCENIKIAHDTMFKFFYSKDIFCCLTSQSKRKKNLICSYEFDNNKWKLWKIFNVIESWWNSKSTVTLFQLTMILFYLHDTSIYMRIYTCFIWMHYLLFLIF